LGGTVFYTINLININLYSFKANQNIFPTLFRLAMDILPVQASSVPYTRVFSSSKETITARRNSLSPCLVEALQLLKYTTKQGREISFIEGLDEVEDFAELEKREKRQSVKELYTVYIYMISRNKACTVLYV